MFQNEVRATLGVAKPGVIIEGASAYRLVDEVYTEAEGILQGSFVRQGTSVEGAIGAIGTTSVLGVVVADDYFSGFDLTTEARVGKPITILKRGCISILAPVDATKNQKVLINNTTGEISFGDTATTGTTDTGWVVEQGCEAGGIAFVLK